MNERLPYEEQLPRQWDALPLPDTDLAWADMKRRLEEDDDRKPVAWWQRGCMIWGFILLVLLGAGWWLLRPGKWFVRNNDKPVANRKESGGKHADNTTSIDTVAYTEKKNDRTPQPAIDTSARIDTVDRAILIPSIDQQRTLDKKIENTLDPNSRSTSKTDKSIKKGPDKKTVSKTGTPGRQRPADSQADRTVKTDPHTVGKSNDKDTVQLKDVTAISNLEDTMGFKPAAKSDTAVTLVKNDTAQTATPANDTTVKDTGKTKEKKQNSYFFSAGVAVHQLLPIAGQQWTPYDASGRKGSLRDYIPSVYFRLNRKDKWFLQAEFRYGAPQLNNGLTYNQFSIPDTGTNPQFTDFYSLKLQKTFYHQLPITFNYFVLPGWTVGAGIQWNRFSGAVVEKESYRRYTQSTTDTFQAKSIERLTGDSALRPFSKNYFLGVVESEYQWKRFSLGARYSFGLQPFIRFTLPGGAQQQQSSTSLQIFLRYQLWRSKER